MASSLTSTGLKSGVIYVFLLLGVVVGVVYLFLIKQPNVRNSLHLQAFKLNFSAFRNGIKLANYHFIVSQNNPPNHGIDRWLDKNIGLDFNSYGFPIGTNVTDISQEKVQTSIQCMQLWQFVLGPLQPPISLIKKPDFYWVELTKNGLCTYQSDNVKNFIINYDPLSGKISLIAV